jgi:hypothetical protein
MCYEKIIIVSTKEEKASKQIIQYIFNVSKSMVLIIVTSQVLQSSYNPFGRMVTRHISLLVVKLEDVSDNYHCLDDVKYVLFSLLALENYPLDYFLL